MNPGATTSFEASMRVTARADDRLPMAAMRSPTRPTSARNQGAPVPSTTRPPAKSRSQSVTFEAGAARARRRGIALGMGALSRML